MKCLRCSQLGIRSATDEQTLSKMNSAPFSHHTHNQPPASSPWVRWVTNFILSVGVVLAVGAVALVISMGPTPEFKDKLSLLTSTEELDGADRDSATKADTESPGIRPLPELTESDKQIEALTKEEAEPATKDEADAVSADEPMQVASTEAPTPPVAEIPGAMKSPHEHVPDLSSAPEDVITDCEKYFPRELEKESRITAMEGPIKCSFSVEFEGYLNQWTLMTVPRLPEDLLSLLVVDPHDDAEFELEVSAGEIIDSTAHSWRYQAPREPGIYCVRIVEKTRDEAMCFHVAVMEPWDGISDTINGYRIGQYQDKPFRDNPRYSKPRGFIEISKEQEDTWLSPHFQVKQFLCKQEGGYPKYLLVEPRLLIKLEMLIERLTGNGLDANRLYILSGFRTPWYNRAIGNKTFYSRHLYGDAADLFVDVNQDGMMDDLDLDGSTTGKDAKVIHQTIQKITEENADLVGGLGFYDNVNYRNPFIHVDTRGYEARWYK